MNTRLGSGVVLALGFSVGLAVALPSPARADRPSLDEISRRLDQLYRAGSSRGRMSMTVQTPHFKRTLTMSVVTRGQEDTLIRILEPRREEGIGTLKKGREMWNYLPKIRKTIRVPPSMMTSSWMGSDFTNDDLVRASSWEKDYTVAWAGAEAKAGELCLVYTPKPTAAVTWSRVVSCVDPKDLLPRTMDYYDEKGRKARTMTFDEVKDLGGRRIPARMVLVPHARPGNRTEIRYEEMTWDVSVPADTFTLSALRRSR